MTFKINKIIAILISILFIVGFVSAMQITKEVTQYFEIEAQISIPLKYLFISNLIETLSSEADSIIAAIWLLIYSKRFGQHGATWFLLGISFGLYAILLFMLFAIFNSLESKKNTNLNFNPIKPLITLIISLSIFFSISKILLVPYLTRLLNPEDFGNLKLLEAYSQYYSILLMIVTKCVLMVAIIIYLKYMKENPWIWAISSLFLGIFPLMLKIGMMIFDKINANHKSEHETLVH